ncbi:MAG: hypothetical protein [Siphoviridae sp. ctpQM7]|nr:MAG: hypothetical protein [Siphoviridae sp. ctpQM7]
MASTPTTSPAPCGTCRHSPCACIPLGDEQESVEATFTAGPWQLDCSDGYFIIGRDGEPVVETVNTLDNKDYPEETAKANAHLLAAAPELLEACKAMERCKGHLPQELWKKFCQPAIAKAEGRSL